MTKHDPRDSAAGGPRLSQRGEAALADRKARQAEALRQNLRKRKDQTRARVAGAVRREDAAAGPKGEGEEGGAP
ncbi:MAG: hypothetical protein QNJ30_18465 [Kiloniellales bacterium]|nr:hypothetical protein [Kiloniellales bacterium]